MFHKVLQLVRRALQPRQVLALATFVALAVVFAFVFAAAPAAAQSTTPPACATLVQGTRFTLPAMVAGQEALVPPVPGATTICVEGLEASEGVALKLEGVSPYTAVGNGTPLTVAQATSGSFTADLALSDPTYNGSLLEVAPALPRGVTLVAFTDLSEGVTLVVGTPQPAAVAAPVAIDQWADVRIPGNIAELAAGKSKWSSNGVNLVVTSGMAYSANGNAMLPELGKTAKFELYVDGVAELELVGTVPGQRFYLSVDADSLATDAWLQRRVEPTTATTSALATAASTAGTQYVDRGGACYSAATCSTAQAVACVSAAPKLPCTPGDNLTVWRAPSARPWLPLILKP